MRATIVITFKEYAPDAALYTVKLKALSRELIITRGNKPTKIVATVKAMPAPLMPNAHPSRFFCKKTIPSP
ncbi:hypothetical protein D3C84_1174140 [compost metagenome]